MGKSYSQTSQILEKRVPARKQKNEHQRQPKLSAIERKKVAVEECIRKYRKSADHAKQSHFLNLSKAISTFGFTMISSLRLDKKLEKQYKNHLKKKLQTAESQKSFILLKKIFTLMQNLDTGNIKDISKLTL